MDKDDILGKEPGTLQNTMELGYLTTMDHLLISGWARKRKVNPLNF